MLFVKFFIIDEKYILKTNLIGYFDKGKPLIQCTYYSAHMWYQERNHRHRDTANPKFQLCCGNGKVQLPFLKPPLPFLQHLLCDSKAIDSRNYQKNIPLYNMMFSFTSPREKFDGSVMGNKGPPTICIQGQTYHRIGSLLSTKGKSPKYAQLYIYDPKNEIKTIIRSTNMLDEHNIYAKSFHMARDRLRDKLVCDLKLRLMSNRSQDGRIYNIPHVFEVVSASKLQRIDDLNTSYLAYQYPLLFLYGEEGYRLDVLYRAKHCFNGSNTNKLTIREWLCFKIQSRENEAQTLFRSRRLFQQFLVDGSTMVGQRSNKGKRVILPSSFVGRQRYMDQLYFDGMTICNNVGLPDLFLTFTSNPNWPQVQNILSSMNLTIVDRLAIVVRVFRIKFEQLLTYLNKKNKLGKVIAYNGQTLIKGGVSIDNHSVVPYNPWLLLRYQDHINIEWCNQSIYIKYLFKYINKGYDHITTMIHPSSESTSNTIRNADEIQHYLDCRYISPCEACCQIFAFPIHGRNPAVEKLFFLLPGLFYLRIMLIVSKGPMTYEEIHTVANIAIREAKDWDSGYFLRKLFVTMLLSNNINNPKNVWAQTWEWLSDGILFEQRRVLHFPDLPHTQMELQNLTLIEIEKLLNKKKNEQMEIFQKIMGVVHNNKGGMYFLYGYGGTSKTFMWKTLSIALHAQHSIVLNVASSSIASLLLPGGQTTYSRLKIPVPTLDNFVCNIHQGSDLAALSLRDIMKTNSNEPKVFWGKVVVFEGYFRQILRVFPLGLFVF
ncbi:hypothetical protein JHK84_028255 [Glycine max]|uniref:ATP-dependent DNA helicase n=1 Tax=Glycine max TaxID=3847 RepID=K7LJ41_SOYBN|nr:hypothetical protein JHK85_028667 [Glycine max]KAG5151783.1 hypothetical protein JHK84_028255 [Glycine max]KAH1138007.1 hypothetical protein GYH30_027847 [Glycine max]